MVSSYSSHSPVKPQVGSVARSPLFFYCLMSGLIHRHKSTNPAVASVIGFVELLSKALSSFE